MTAPVHPHYMGRFYLDAEDQERGYVRSIDAGATIALPADLIHEPTIPLGHQKKVCTVTLTWQECRALRKALRLAEREAKP